MLNIVCLMGRLVADPQLRRTSTGRSVTSFRLAVDRSHKSADGQRQADFIDVVAWEHTAEFVGRNFGKGSLIALEGRLQSRTWQDSNGNNRQSVEVVASSVHFTGESARRAPAQPPAAPAYTGGAEDDDGFVDLGDGEDIPF